MKKVFSINQILVKGIFSTLLMSALLGEGIVFGWYIFSQYKTRKQYESILTNFYYQTVKNSSGFWGLEKLQEFKSLTKAFPIKCGYLKYGEEKLWLRDESNCETLLDKKLIWTSVGDVGNQVKFEYVLDTKSALAKNEFKPLLIVFLIVFCCLVLTWFLLSRILRASILDPLKDLTLLLQRNKKELFKDFPTDCEEIQVLSNCLYDFYQKLEKNTRYEIAQNVSRQFAHDIRSPLSVLQAVVSDNSELNEEKRLILRNVLLRIQDISNQILKQGRKQENAQGAWLLDSVGSEPLLPLLEHICLEKKIEARHRKVEFFDLEVGEEAYFLCSMVDPLAFKNIVSNLINNAFEAIPAHGFIKIKLKKDKGFSIVEIHDNGKGIPESVIPFLMRKGFSYGKAEGNGLGLFSAKETVESWGGKLVVVSEYGHGTTVRIYLPSSIKPDWFLEKLVVQGKSGICVLDDDPLALELWQKKISSHAKLQFQGYESPELFRKGISNLTKKDTFFLMDYEILDASVNGVHLIREFGLENVSALVTQYYEDPKIRLVCNYHKIPLIPKNIARWLKVEVA